MNNRHYFLKANPQLQTQEIQHQCYGAMFHFPLFIFPPHKKIWNALGSLSQLRYRWSQSNVEHGQHSQKMFSVYFLVNNFHGGKKKR